MRRDRKKEGVWWEEVEGDETNEVGRQVRGRGAHYAFHWRVWNPINQAEERRDAERMRSPFTLMRPGRGKRSTT